MVEEIVAAERFALMSLAVAQAMVAWIGLWRGSWNEAAPADVRRSRWWGIALLGTGLAVHQAYWWIWQQALVARITAISGAMVAWSFWVMLPCYLAMLAGCAGILAGYTQARFGERWRAASAAIVAGLLGIGFVTALGVRP